jgi:Tfp pilus assembly protein PilF
MIRPVNNSKLNNAAAYHLAIIALLGALIYSNTITSSFQLDDKLNIVDNPYIRQIGNLWPPTGSRWFGLLTFALNYMIGGPTPAGYHLVNTCIHILTAATVYHFIRLTSRAPYFSENRTSLISFRHLAFACALLFVAHPLQTQAVTYIVQRFASLAALLFMLALNFYVGARLVTPGQAATSGSWWKKIFLYSAAALAAAASLKTKENAVTLPLVIIMYEMMFLGGFTGVSAAIARQRRVFVSLAGLLLMALAFVGKSCNIQRLFDGFRATNEISRHDYLLTQFRVIVAYIRLLLLPVNQMIDHHVTVSTAITEPAVAASLALIILLAGVAAYLFKVSRAGGSYLRLVSFGILWFFITLSVESGLIPISDVMVEHRVYLPSIGALLAVAAAFAFIWEKCATNRRHALRVAAGILAVAVVTLSCTAYRRNLVWRNELTLWSDAIVKNPANPRGYNMVGIYFLANERLAEAIYYFKKALAVDGSYAEARSNLGGAYLQTGRIDEGLSELMTTAQANRFDAIDSGVLYYNIGKALQLKGLPDQAIENLNKALFYTPNEPAVYFLLGEIFKLKNVPEKSAAMFRVAHDLDPARF